MDSIVLEKNNIIIIYKEIIKEVSSEFDVEKGKVFRLEIEMCIFM